MYKKKKNPNISIYNFRYQNSGWKKSLRVLWRLPQPLSYITSYPYPTSGYVISHESSSLRNVRKRRFKYEFNMLANVYYVKSYVYDPNITDQRLNKK